jgi:hypothetical protein
VLDAAIRLELEFREWNRNRVARSRAVLAPVIEPERVREVAVPFEGVVQDIVEVPERRVGADSDRAADAGIVVERGLEDVRLLGHLRLAAILRNPGK